MNYKIFYRGFRNSLSDIKTVDSILQKHASIKKRYDPCPNFCKINPSTTMANLHTHTYIYIYIYIYMYIFILKHMIDVKMSL